MSKKISVYASNEIAFNTNINNLNDDLVSSKDELNKMKIKYDQLEKEWYNILTKHTTIIQKFDDLNSDVLSMTNDDTPIHKQALNNKTEIESSKVDLGLLSHDNIQPLLKKISFISPKK